MQNNLCSPGSEPFERMAEKYDAWFDGKEGASIFKVETDCVSKLLKDLPRPWLEVGVGTGRFAEALDVDEGVDPSRSVLDYALRRGIRTRIGQAEDLPYERNCFGAVLLAVTICFVDDPVRALNECHRILRDDGGIIMGLVPEDSPWGKLYARKGREGHPFYSVAKFYTVDRIIELAENTGLYLDSAASCLFEPPGMSVDVYQQPQKGVVGNAGFVGMRFMKHRDLPEAR